MHKLSQYGIISVSQICSCIGKHISYLKSVLHMAYVVLHMAYGIWFPYGFAYGIWHIWFFCIWQVSKKKQYEKFVLGTLWFSGVFFCGELHNFELHKTDFTPQW